ncbi:MAG: Short-chain dehydrogenase/reductase [Paenibacillus sp.]|jgi:3-oxoacyl-[acyl-carrier protein] reductase|nr:Short-chain dehydrogenase/reductase [Paenibacillus sp.]
MANQNNNLPQRPVAIVTGASRRSGIGTAICRALAQRGTDIFFTHWQSYDSTMEWGAEENWPEELARELREAGVRTEHTAADLSLPGTPAELIDRVKDRLGHPSILVNNATHSTTGGFMELNAAGLDAHYAVNVRGTCLLSVHFAQSFKQNGLFGGRIINMISGQDKGPMPGELAYVATKGAISAFTVSLAAEIAHLGITVNAVDPGPTNSGWMEAEQKKAILTKFPMGRLGLPQDAARLVSFLAGEEAEWITGQIIHSDGGFRD